MSGHVSEVNLPVIAWVASLELVQGLAYLEGSLQLPMAHFWQVEWTCNIWA